MPEQRWFRRAAGSCLATRTGRRCGPRRLAVEALEDRRLLAVLNVGGGAKYATLQAAVDAARPGDVVLIASGNYHESVDLSRMGVAFGGPTGNLILRGNSAEHTVVAPAGQAAFFNSAAFAGDLTIEQLTVTGAAAGAGVSGVRLQQWTGDLAITEAVFEQLSDSGLDVAGLTGDVWLQSILFDRVGDSALDDAVRLSEVSGAGVVSGNNFVDGRGTALFLSSVADRVATWLVDDNRLKGDGSLFSTTATGVRVRLAGASRTDLILDSNTFAGLAGSAIDVQVQDQAELQTRWSLNSAGNLQGVAAAQVALQDSASLALLGETNTWNDLYGGGVSIRLEDAADLRAILQYDAFTMIGDGQGDTPDEALTISTAANATGAVDLFLYNNTFSTVSGNGLRIAAGGNAAIRAVVAETIFDETNTITPGAALVVEHPAVGGQASVDLRLDNNSVSRNEGGGYLLQQRGTATMRLEGSAATAAAQIAAQNTGGPVTVTGTVSLIAPWTLDASLPLLLGDTVWRDNGDGVQNTGEEGLGGIVIHLTGTETASGAAVNRITQSDATGRYLFPSLAAGTYTLTLDVPFAMRLATANQGADDATDNDFDPATAQAVVVLTSPADDMTVDAGLWITWQNPRNPLDVNDDGHVLPLDALVLINDINARGTRPLPIPPVSPVVPPPYLDVSGNGDLGPQDVLMVINFLNASTAGGAGEGEAAEAAGADHQAASAEAALMSCESALRPRETSKDAANDAALASRYAQMPKTADSASTLLVTPHDSGRSASGWLGIIGTPAPHALFADDVDEWFAQLATDCQRVQLFQL